MKRTLLTLSVVLALFAGLGASWIAWPDGRAAASTGRVVEVIEHPGYFETRGAVYNLEAGELTFVVKNRSGKDAGFVFQAAGAEPQAIGIKNGEEGELKVTLKAGSYEYFCPIIPTPKYAFQVK